MPITGVYAPFARPAGRPQPDLPIDMSVTIGDETDIRNCDHCDNVFKHSDSPRDFYCSHECYYTDKGQGALNQLASDHRICSSCYRYIKTVQAPSSEWLERKADKVDNAIQHGGEYTSGPDGTLELDATDCSTTRHTADPKNTIIGYQHPTEHTEFLYGDSGKWICQCGNVDVHSRDDVLARLDTETTIRLLLARLEELYEMGAIQKSPDAGVFRQAFAGENWEYAVGKALYY